MKSTTVNFPAARVRKAIEEAMRMGMPDETSERIQFGWNPASGSPSISDSTGVPWNLNSNGFLAETPRLVSVPYSVRKTGITGTEHLGFGSFTSTAIEVTVIDVHYQKIADADYILWDGKKYPIIFREGPEALFEIEIYKIIAKATT